jgi:hypothetical protein
MKTLLAFIAGLFVGWWLKPKKEYPPFDKEEVRQAVMKTHRDAWDKVVKETGKSVELCPICDSTGVVWNPNKGLMPCPYFSIVAERVKPIQEQEEAHTNLADRDENGRAIGGVIPRGWMYNLADTQPIRISSQSEEK